MQHWQEENRSLLKEKRWGGADGNRKKCVNLEHFERSLQWSQIHWEFQIICIFVRDSDVLCLINLVCSFFTGEIKDRTSCASIEQGFVCAR